MHSLYSFTVPVYIKILGGLKNVLNKAKASLATNGMSEADFLAKNLAADMFPLSKQVQIACDNAKGMTFRLAGQEVPVHEDTETTFDELLARIDKTIALIQTVPESAFEGAEERQIILPYFLKFFPGKYLTGLDYARENALPNFFFHVNMAYAIVRSQGVDIGKADYMNGLPLKDLT